MAFERGAVSCYFTPPRYFFGTVILRQRGPAQDAGAQPDWAKPPAAPAFRHEIGGLGGRIGGAGMSCWCRHWRTTWDWADVCQLLSTLVRLTSWHKEYLCSGAAHAEFHVGTSAALRHFSLVYHPGVSIRLRKPAALGRTSPMLIG